jgi:hypothetical protein
MGQYYKCVNLDRSIALHPHEFDHGAKLMEHAYIGTAITNAAMILLATSWRNTRIVWAGDYADDEACYRDLKIDIDNPKNLYTRTSRTLAPRKRLPRVPRYLINLDRREVIDLFKIPCDDGATLHPLPLLTADGNGRGGGDFRSEDPRVGTWARQRLAAADHPPLDYTLIDGHFVERAEPITKITQPQAAKLTDSATGARLKICGPSQSPLARRSSGNQNSGQTTSYEYRTT